MPLGTGYCNQRDAAVGDGAITDHSVLSAHGSVTDGPLLASAVAIKSGTNWGGN